MADTGAPRTEAGRSWLANRERYESWHPIDGRRDETLTAILDIEREAAVDATVYRLLRDTEQAGRLAAEREAADIDVERQRVIDAAVRLIDGIDSTWFEDTFPAAIRNLRAALGELGRAQHAAIEDVSARLRASDTATDR